MARSPSPRPCARTVTASSATFTYGGTVPTVTPSYSGLVNGDTDPATAAHLLDRRHGVEPGGYVRDHLLGCG